jgi:hypothetical protein
MLRYTTVGGFRRTSPRGDDTATMTVASLKQRVHADVSTTIAVVSTGHRTTQAHAVALRRGARAGRIPAAISRVGRPKAVDRRGSLQLNAAHGGCGVESRGAGVAAQTLPSRVHERDDARPHDDDDGGADAPRNADAAAAHSDGAVMRVPQEGYDEPPARHGDEHHPQANDAHLTARRQCRERERERDEDDERARVQRCGLHERDAMHNINRD